MLRLNQSGKDWFTITDDAGGQVSATKAELNGLYQQLIRVKGGLSSEKEDTYMVVLKKLGSRRMVQLELSKSAYDLLNYLDDENWLESDVYLDEDNEIKSEKFI